MPANTEYDDRTALYESIEKLFQKSYSSCGSGVTPLYTTPSVWSGVPGISPEAEQEIAREVNELQVRMIMSGHPMQTLEDFLKKISDRSVTAPAPRTISPSSPNR